MLGQSRLLEQKGKENELKKGDGEMKRGEDIINNCLTGCMPTSLREQERAG